MSFWFKLNSFALSLQILVGGDIIDFFSFDFFEILYKKAYPINLGSIRITR